MNKITIILKSGYVINVTSKNTALDMHHIMNINPGSCLNLGKSFILCSEIAAVMEAD